MDEDDNRIKELEEIIKRKQDARMAELELSIERADNDRIAELEASIAQSKEQNRIDEEELESSEVVGEEQSKVEGGTPSAQVEGQDPSAQAERQAVVAQPEEEAGFFSEDTLKAVINPLARAASAGIDTVGNVGNFFAEWEANDVDKQISNAKLAKDMGVDAYARHLRNEINKKHDRQEGDDYFERVTDIDKAMAQEHLTLDIAEAEAKSEWVRGIGKTILDWTKNSEINTTVRAALDEDIKSNSTQSINIFSGEGNLGEKMNNLADTLAPIATQIATAILTGGANIIPIVADTEADVVKRSKDVGLTDEEIEEFKTGAVIQSAAYGFLGDKLKIGELPFVGKLWQALSQKTSGKLLGIVGSGVAGGVGELLEADATDSAIINAMLKSGRYSKEDIEKQFPDIPFYKNPGFLIGAGLGGLPAIMSSVTKLKPVPPTEAEAAQIELLKGSPEARAQLEAEQIEGNAQKTDEMLSETDTFDRARLAEEHNVDPETMQDASGNIPEAVLLELDKMDAVNTRNAEQEYEVIEKQRELKELSKEIVADETAPADAIKLLKKRRALENEIKLSEEEIKNRTTKTEENKKIVAEENAIQKKAEEEVRADARNESETSSDADDVPTKKESESTDNKDGVDQDSSVREDGLEVFTPTPQAVKETLIPTPMTEPQRVEANKALAAKKKQREDAGPEIFTPTPAKVVKVTPMDKAQQAESKEALTAISNMREDTKQAEAVKTDKAEHQAVVDKADSKIRALEDKVAKTSETNKNSTGKAKKNAREANRKAKKELEVAKAERKALVKKSKVKNTSRAWRRAKKIKDRHVKAIQERKDAYTESFNKRRDEFVAKARKDEQAKKDKLVSDAQSKIDTQKAIDDNNIAIGKEIAEFNKNKGLVKAEKDGEVAMADIDTHTDRLSALMEKQAEMKNRDPRVAKEISKVKKDLKDAETRLDQSLNDMDVAVSKIKGVNTPNHRRGRKAVAVPPTKKEMARTKREDKLNKNNDEAKLDKEIIAEEKQRAIDDKKAVKKEKARKKREAKKEAAKPPKVFTPTPAPLPAKTFTPAPTPVKVFTPAPTKAKDITFKKAEPEVATKTKKEKREERATEKAEKLESTFDDKPSTPKETAQDKSRGALGRAIDTLSDKLLSLHHRAGALTDANDIMSAAYAKIPRSVKKNHDIKPFKLTGDMSVSQISDQVKAYDKAIAIAKNSQAKSETKAKISETIKKMADATKTGRGEVMVHLNKALVEHIDTIKRFGGKVNDRILRKVRDGEPLSHREMRKFKQMSDPSLPHLNDMTGKELEVFNKKLDMLADDAITYSELIQANDNTKIATQAKIASDEINAQTKSVGSKSNSVAEDIVTAVMLPNEMFKRLTGGAGYLRDRIYKPIESADHNFTIAQDKTSSALDSIMPWLSTSAIRSKFDSKKDKISSFLTKPSVKFGNETITPNQAMVMYSLAKSESGMKTLTDSGWKAEDIASMEINLDAKYKKSADEYMERLRTEVYEKANLTSMDVNGTELGKLDNFFPVRGLKEIQGEAGTIESIKRTYTTNGDMNSTLDKSRKGNKGFESIDDLDFLGTVKSYEADANRYNSHAKTLINANALLQSSDVQTAIGDQSPLMKEKINDWFELQVKNKIREGGSSPAIQVAKSMMGKTIRSIFALSHTITIKQASSMAWAGVHINPTQWANLVSAGATPAKRAIAQAKSKVLKGRSPKDIFTDLDAPKASVRRKGKAHRAVSEANAIINEALDVLTVPIQMMDSFTVHGVWYAKYKSTLNKDGTNEAEAVTAADDLVIETQPSYSNRDRTSIARNQFAAAFAPFASALTVQLNNTRKVFVGGKKTGLTKAERIRTAGGIIAGMVAISYVDEMSRYFGATGEDDKKKLKNKIDDIEINVSLDEFAKGSIGGLVGPLPLINGMVNSLYNNITNQPQYIKDRDNDLAFSPIQGVMGVMTNATTYMIAVSSGDLAKQDKNLEKLFNSIGEASGSPVRNVKKVGLHLKGIMRMMRHAINSGELSPSEQHRAEFIHAEAFKLKRLEEKKSQSEKQTIHKKNVQHQIDKQNNHF